MEEQYLKIREQQKLSWNKFSSGWQEWDDLTMDFLKPFGDEIIQQLNLKDTDFVLDVAAGTGEPGLSIATIVKNGQVMMTDLADDMLVVAYENAQKKKIKNIEFCACDVCELPFSDNTFDAISCRFGFMFFQDMFLAVKEMIRVLKPGGRISTSVWNISSKNFWMMAIVDVINKNLPILDANTTGIFRCAKDGLMTDLFSQAGLKNISQKEIFGEMNCQTVDTYWNVMTSVVAPIVEALSKTDDATKEKIKEEVYQVVNQKYPDGKVLLPGNALVVSGEKL